MIDLLASLPNSSSSSSSINNNNNNNSLSVVEDKVTGITTVKGLTIQPVTTEEEALHLLFEGEMNRSISEHQLNSNSTRSHCIFTVYLESRSKVESSERVIYSKLNLVDLAGSERLSKTETSGISLKEAMCMIYFFITFYIFRIFFFLI
jgi:kinesin family protein 6/9